MAVNKRPQLPILALLAGGTPLVFGTAIFLSFWLTKWSWLPFAGLVLILISLPVFFAGVWFLHRYRKDNLNAGSPAGSWRLKYMLSAFLLLLNFPAAALYTQQGIAIQTCITVKVLNHSGETLQHISLVGGGIDAAISEIPPDRSGNFRVWAKCDGELRLRVSSKTGTNEKVVIGYVTGGMSDDATVAVGKNLDIKITR